MLNGALFMRPEQASPYTEALEEEVMNLRRQLSRLKENLTQEHAERVRLKERVELALRKLFGRSSERLSRELNELQFEQLSFEGLEDLLGSGNDSASEETGDEEQNGSGDGTQERRPASSKRPRAAAGKRAEERKKSLHELMAALDPEIIVEKGQPPECGICGSLMRRIGYRDTEEFVVVPPQCIRRVHRTPVYGCAECEKHGVVVPIQPAEMQFVRPLDGCLASAETLAWILCQKIVLALPFYRIEQFMALTGIPVSRATMTNWMIAACEAWLASGRECMRREMVNQNLLHADETKYQVLAEDGRNPQSTGYVWLYCSAYLADGERYVLLDYQPSRGAHCPKAFLEGFLGTLVTDGYSAYKSLANDVRGIFLSGCWAHVRRKWFEAFQINSDPTGVAGIGLAYVEMLFLMERIFDEYSLTDRFCARLYYVRPMLDEFHEWLMTLEPGKTKVGDAITYTKNQWDDLYNYMSDARVPATNAAAELIAKNFAVGRKNFLFSGTPRGAHALMCAYSVIETAKANGLNPYEYLMWLFTELPKCWKAFGVPAMRTAEPQIDRLLDCEVIELEPVLEQAVQMPDSPAFPRPECMKLIRQAVRNGPVCAAEREEMRQSLIMELKVIIFRSHLPSHAPPTCRCTPASIPGSPSTPEETLARAKS